MLFSQSHKQQQNLAVNLKSSQSTERQNYASIGAASSKHVDYISKESKNVLLKFVFFFLIVYAIFSIDGDVLQYSGFVVFFFYFSELIFAPNLNDNAIKYFCLFFWPLNK